MLAGFRTLFERRLPTLVVPPSRGIADPHNPGVRQLVVRLDAPTFERVARAAAAAQVSTSEAVRQLIRRGLASREG